MLARFDFTYDQEAAKRAASLGLDPSELLSVIDANEAAIEKSGVVLHSLFGPSAAVPGRAAVAAERVRDSHAEALAGGRPPWPQILQLPPGA